MNIILIEAQKKDTPEHHFITTILQKFFPRKKVEIIPMDGVDNLFNASIINLILQAIETGSNVMAIIDADTKEKGWGFDKRKSDIENKQQNKKISFPFFLYPNNKDDGDVETLMETIARRDLHSIFFDCYEDYEKCIRNAKDHKSKLPLYNIPNRKGKLHTFISAQQLSNQQRRHIGKGDWLFECETLWNLDNSALEPLKEFFATHLR